MDIPTESSPTPQAKLTNSESPILRDQPSPSNSKGLDDSCNSRTVNTTPQIIINSTLDEDENPFMLTIPPTECIKLSQRFFDLEPKGDVPLVSEVGPRLHGISSRFHREGLERARRARIKKLSQTNFKPKTPGFLRGKISIDDIYDLELGIDPFSQYKIVVAANNSRYDNGPGKTKAQLDLEIESYMQKREYADHDDSDADQILEMNDLEESTDENCNEVNKPNGVKKTQNKPRSAIFQRIQKPKRENITGPTLIGYDTEMEEEDNNDLEDNDTFELDQVSREALDQELESYMMNRRSKRVLAS